MNNQLYYIVISEKKTCVSNPQEYKAESRRILFATSARDFRDFVENNYRKKGDNRNVLVVQILDKDVLNKQIEKGL